MFDGIRNWLRELRVQSDFGRYEKLARDQHLREMEEKFPVTALQEELQSLLKKIEVEASARYQPGIDRREQECESIRHAIEKANRDLGYFERDYGAELEALHERKDGHYRNKDELYRSMARLSERRADHQKEKASALGALDDAKGSVDAWYAQSQRSPWLLGNAGRELPRYSLFGQSLNELEGYKAARDEAYQEVKRCGEDVSRLSRSISDCYHEIGEIKRQIAELKQRIHAVHRDRDHKRELQRAGQSRSTILDQLSRLRTRLTEKTAEAEALRKERGAFVEAGRERYGVPVLEERITELARQADGYRRAFEKASRRAQRVREHRSQWLKERNLRDWK